jgi:hypothetical protein
MEVFAAVFMLYRFSVVGGCGIVSYRQRAKEKNRGVALMQKHQTVLVEFNQ